MRLTNDQKRLVAKLAEAHESLVLDRSMVRQRLQDMLDKEMETKARVQSKLAHDALEAGVPKIHIGAALGTRDWKTINDVLDLTREERQAEAEMTRPKEPWVFDEEACNVTLYEWGGGDTGWPEETGEFVVLLVPGAYEKKWSLDPEQERRPAISLTMYDTVLPILNNEVPPAPMATPETETPEGAYAYPTPRAWKPEDDEENTEW